EAGKPSRSSVRPRLRLVKAGASSSRPAGALRREAVRERPGRSLAAFSGHDQQILDAAAADSRDDRSGLNRDDITGDQRFASAPVMERSLMDLEPDAVAKAEVEPLA